MLANCLLPTNFGGVILGFIRDVTRSQIFMESSEEFNHKYFGVKVSKFLHNVDTFYYTVSLKDDFNKNPAVNDFIYELAEKKNEFKESKELIHFSDKLYVRNGRFSDVYEFRLTCPDKYDIFISSYLPNNSTPRIVVQLRSSALWIDGVRETIEDSYYQLLKVLMSYNLHVGLVYENRIDYCYHTNYIQNMYKFFNDDVMDKHLKTNMTDWRKQGKKFSSGFTLEYFALGDLKSNNVFVRIYNKTREVVEMQYKGFFIEIWFQEGLISAYDKYCLQHAYKKGNYERIYEGMLNFYLDFGTDKQHIREIELYLQDYDTNFDKIRDLALSLLPKVTTVCNIEFQTKRKFYYYAADEYINNFNIIIPGCENLNRLFKILYNRKEFLNYITHYNIRFIDSNGEYSSWWNRLRNLKLDCLDTDRRYAREYSTKLDIEKIKVRSIRSVATHALYNNKVDSTFMEDVTDFICSLNDNDITDINNSYKLADYQDYKEKRYTALRNRISHD